MTDQEKEQEHLYTETQQAILTLIPVFTGTLSALGSLSIVYIITKDRKKKLTHVYHRLVLAMSCLDVMNSSNYALSALVVPKGTPGVWGASGSIATCSASGFVMQFGVSVPLYSGCLAIYYLMVIRYRIHERQIKRYYEPIMHLVSVGYPLVSAIIPLLHDMYNPMGSQAGWCFLKDSPANCSVDPDVDCLRGENYESVMIFSTMLPVTLNFLFIIFCMVMVSAYVWRQSNASQQWMFKKKGGINHAVETVKQSFLYIFFFWLTFIWQLAVIFTSKEETPENRSFYFGFVVMIKIFLPLQGFWNFFIYVRPRYCSLRRSHPDVTPLGAFRALFTDQIDGQSALIRTTRIRRLKITPTQDSGASHYSANSTAMAEVYLPTSDALLTDEYAPELQMNTEGSTMELSYASDVEEPDFDEANVTAGDLKGIDINC